jgi:hypothetical protein
MGCGQVEIVVGSVEIGRHGGEEAGAVLPVARPALDYAGDLCNGVGLVRRFERTGEEVLLTERLGGKFRVDAGTPQKYQALDTMAT